MNGQTATHAPEMSPGPAAPGTPSGRGRTLVLKMGLLAFFAAVVVRLVQIQVLEASRYQEIARRQHQLRVDIPASRGIIYDRSGTIIASNAMFVSFGADPKLLGGRASLVADRFARVFNRPRAWYMAKIGGEESRFVWLERRAAPDVARRINTAGIHGLKEFKEPRRLYHYGSLAAQVIGYTDVDNVGLDGVELLLNEHLQGKSGYTILQRDGRGGANLSVDYPYVAPINGKDVVLTIDVQYQSIAEEELRRGIERTKATSGLVVMLDPATGEVLAVANHPAVDPNHLTAADRPLLKNRAITDMFEPGSVFKVVTASAAIEGRHVGLDERFNAENGTYRVKMGREKPRVIKDTHPYGMVTFRQAVEVSSNIVMAKVSDRIGAEEMYTMARDFGFGTETGVDLPGEISGELKKPTSWSKATLNSLAFGYEVGVTPLQIVAAYGAVANGGVLMKPYIVRAVVDGDGQVVKETPPQKVRRVISQETSRTLTGVLEGVVERGTGTPARVPGVRCAGKTGTSWKYVNGAYDRGSYTASFVGFFPADNPKVVCLVMLDNPRDGGYTGGQVSAPIFRGIAQKVYAMSGRFSPEKQSIANAVAVPDVRLLKADHARALLTEKGFTVEVRGQGSVVRSQKPPAGTLLAPGKEVVLATGEAPSRAPYTEVPDLRGLSIRRAINSLTLQQLEASVAGSGVVVAQTPVPGQQVKVGTRVLLRCEPRGSIIAGL